MRQIQSCWNISRTYLRFAEPGASPPPTACERHGRKLVGYLIRDGVDAHRGRRLNILHAQDGLDPLGNNPRV